MTAVEDILAVLDERRRKLGMSESVVAQRANLSLSTVQRAFAGTGNPSFAAVAAIASALGAKLAAGGEEVTRVRERQASAKAEKLVRLVQGSSALENQAADAIAKMVRDALTA